MQYTSIPYVTKPVSRLMLGAAGARFANGEDVSDLMETALSCGINALDTARVYGESEAAIGRWLQKSGRRDEIVLISKGCHPNLAFLARVNEQAAADDLQRSLELLGTDHIDVYLLHRDQESVPVGRIVDFLNRFHEEGKIGAFGGSNWTAHRVAEANEYAEKHGLTGFTVSSPHYSLGRQKHDPWGNGCRTVTGDKNADQRQYYRETGIPVLAWSSLCNGVFSGKLKSENWAQLQKLFGINARWAYGCPDNRERLARCERLAREKGTGVAQLVLAWLLGDEMNVLPIISASSPARIRDTAVAANLTLTPEERAYLNLEREQ